MRALLILVPLLVASGASPSPPTISPTARCFPSEASLDDFRMKWYCRQLAAASEGRIDSAVLYRFSYIPSFDPTRVAVVTLEDGRPFIAGKVLSGHGGYDPGTLSRTTKRELRPEELRLLEQRLENAEVWGAAFTDDRRGLDGAEWIFEGKRQGKYYFHDVWSPGTDFPQYRKAAAYMLELAGVQPTDRDLY
jgi:hypothetical protein